MGVTPSGTRIIYCYVEVENLENFKSILVIFGSILSPFNAFYLIT